MADEIFHELLNRAAQGQVPELQTQEPAPSPSPKKEGSTLPLLLYLLGAGADAGTTAYAQKSGLAHEANPAISWAGKAAVPVGAGMELGGVLLARHFLKDSHPKIYNGILSGLGATHAGLAVHNVNQIGQAKQERDAAEKFRQLQADTPPKPGMKRLPDGSWIDPDYFPNQ